MMSRISGNQTNNSEQPNASISGARTTTATDIVSAAAAAATALNKQQRKKRKKKKDKTYELLTNQAANCSCGKRIENGCNSSSTCSNCVASACVYCHFNDLAYRENSVHFQDNFYDSNNLNNNSSTVNFWPQKIENHDVHCDLTNDSNANSKYFMRHQRNVALNRRTEQLQRFAIYENLCEFCGFAIGNGAYHLHCDANNRNIHTDTDQRHAVKSENIYENICESCHSLFDGEQCTSEICKRNTNSSILESVPKIAGEVINVLVKKPPIAATNRQFGKQFSEFLGSFKQKLTSKPSECERKRPKIEIIHNTDEVFKTNKTFDLNEIVELRNQSLASAQKSSACSELKNYSVGIETPSKCFDIEVPSKPIRLFRTSNSESNFLENYHLTPPHLQSPFSESIVSDTILYSNSYAPPSYEDAIQQSKYARVDPFKLTARIKPKVYDSTSASSFFSYNSSTVSTLQSHSFAAERKSPLVSWLLDSDGAVKQWLTSLLHQTHEYADDNRHFDCGSTKCLPSKMLNENASKLNWSIESRHSENKTTVNMENDTQTNFLQRIELFKENLMEHRMQSKRNAIYIKDSLCDATMMVTSMLPPDTVSPDIGMTSVPSNILPFHHRNGSDTAENGDEAVCLRLNKQLTPLSIETSLICASNNEPYINHNVALEATSKYLQMLKTFYMTQVTLSSSLNRITLVCGDRRVHFFLKFLVGQSHTSLQCSNKLVQPTEHMNFEQIIELIHKMSVTRQLGECDKDATKRQQQHHIGRFDEGKKGRPLRVNAFLMRSTNLVSRIPLRSRHKRTIDDFAKHKHQTPRNDSVKVKTLDDFSRPILKDSDIPSKSLNDFTKIPVTHDSDYSSLQQMMDTSRDTNTGTLNTVDDTLTKKDSLKRNEESIYQPIWLFKTVGTGIDTTYDADSLNNFDTCENESDATTTHDGHEWEVAQEEFLFSTQRIDHIQHSKNPDISHDAETKSHLSDVNVKHVLNGLNDKICYQTICILHNAVDPKWNEIIYDYNGNSMQLNANINQNRMHEGSNSNVESINETRPNETCEFEKQTRVVSNKQNVEIKLDSVNAWKAMLRAVDYIEDEEDVILSESYLLNQKSAEYNNQNNDNLRNAQSVDSVADTTKSSIQSDDKNEETDLSSTDLSTNSSASSISPNGAANESKSKKESGFLNKLQYRRFDITKNNSKKDDVVQGLFYKNLNGKVHAESSPPMEIKRLNQTGTIVFGTTLDDVEKDDKLTDIPKFVVECFKVIELEENLQTNGIYRASGKKDSIDKLRKRMNESKLRRGTKYVSLKDEDVHTVTGAVKQFFRELKTELIPENIVKNLPNDLESESSLVSIRNGISTIDYLSRETLKYLLQHLRRVDANKEHNLMNASNLSIVWGASLFTSSVSITNAFETSDLLRRNTLIKVLIQRYDEIFVDTDRLI